MAKQPRSAPPRPSRGLTEDDREAWQTYIADNASKPRLKKQPPRNDSGPGPPQGPSRKKTPPRGPSALTIAPARSTLRQIRKQTKQDIPRLDLHGYTLHAAFAKLRTFVLQCVTNHVACVEIITGQGKDLAGTIRTEFPIWINHPDLRPHIRKAQFVSLQNAGAVYLDLRASRSHPANPCRVQEDINLFSPPHET